MTVYIIGDYLFYSLEAAQKYLTTKEQDNE